MKQNRIEVIRQELAQLPPGNLVYKLIKGKRQPYLQWTENGKTISKYVKISERAAIFAQLEQKKKLQQELKQLEKSASALQRESPPMAFQTHVIFGNELQKMCSAVQHMKRRDCFSQIEKYIHGNYPGRICLLYGLRRTGKTTLLLQMLQSMSQEDFSHAVYIKIRTTDTMAAVNHDLKQLAEAGYQYIFIDEVTLMEDFIDSAALFSDVYAMMDMKIVLSGTDSLGFWFTLTQELYDRAFAVHTTFIPFHEYSRLLDIDSIDTYIQYGGTLRMGETAFDDADLLQEEASFRDDESTRRYIDTAICKNIQHSLSCCEDGHYFRHLRGLYDAGELTGAINRLIESMNHQFLIQTLTEKFKSHDLGSAAQLLRKQSDPAKRSDILDHIDKESVTAMLMEMLEIRNLEDQTIGLTQIHIDEIKEYLTALDLIVDCPSETAADTSPAAEYVIFTQPGMRYSQAQALIHVLLKDPKLASVSQRERDMVCDKILEDVRGRMMEDMILLETHRCLPKEKHAFKLILPRSEFDMVIYDTTSYTCEAYEIKHAAAITPYQYHVLEDEEACSRAEQIYGPITKKCVLYRGENTILPNGIEYKNAEEYLKELQ